MQQDGFEMVIAGWLWLAGWAGWACWLLAAGWTLGGLKIGGRAGLCDWKLSRATLLEDWVGAQYVHQHFKSVCVCDIAQTRKKKERIAEEMVRPSWCSFPPQATIGGCTGAL